MLSSLIKTTERTPTVSVVMSVYNGERFLRQAVDSILDQSFGEFEFIIIDDGSSDGSASILKSYEKDDLRVRVYRQENKGLPDSLNWGCNLATGQYIARMDCDDIAVRDRFMWQVEFMEKHQEVGVVGGAVIFMDATGRAVNTCRFPMKDGDIKSALLRGDSPFCHPAVLIRREVFATVGGYRRIVIDAEDYDLFLRIADRFQLANLPEVVLKYRRHPYQTSIRNCKQQALNCVLARVAAVSRKNGAPDPLSSVTEITPAVLASLGVTKAVQGRTLGRLYLTRIRSLYDIGEYEMASNAIGLFRRSDWKHFGGPVLGDFRLMVARVHWREGRFARSFLAASHALLARPIILGRPLKRLFRRFSAAIGRNGAQATT